MSRRASKKRVRRVKVVGVSIWPQPLPIGGTYRLSYTLGMRHRTEYTGCNDMTVVQDRASVISAMVQRERAGLPETEANQWQQVDLKTLDQYLGEWAEFLQSERERKHAKQFEAYARVVLQERLGVSKVSLIRRRDVKPVVYRIASEVSGYNAKRHLDAVKAFLSWGVKNDFWPVNVLKGMPSPPVEDGGRPRRTLQPDEFASLIVATLKGPVRAGLIGKQRALIYRTAFSTSRRVSELRRRVVADLTTGEDAALLFVKQVNTKTRKTVAVPIHLRLADELRSQAVNDPMSPLLYIPANQHRWFKADLQAAGIQYITSEGRADFHGIRHTAATLHLAATGDLKAVQDLLGHTRATTTLDVYSHVLQARNRASATVLAGFDPLLNGGVESVAQRPAQRKSVGEGRYESSSVGVICQIPAETDWSDGESNPDLLNAIQPSSR
jgi:integrase